MRPHLTIDTGFTKPDSPTMPGEHFPSVAGKTASVLYEFYSDKTPILISFILQSTNIGIEPILFN